MKRFFIFFTTLFFFFSFYSCETEDSGSKNENPPSEVINTDTTTDKTYITFKNNSSYPVSVYYGESPYWNPNVFSTVAANGSAKAEFTGNTDATATFFFVYNFDFGSSTTVFPYFSSDSDVNHKSLKVAKNATTEVVIDEITKCTTKSAFLLLENQTTSSIYILLVDNPITPYGADSKFITAGSSAAYEIGDDGNFLLESAYRAKICINAETMDLPEINYEAGSIYTVTVTNSGASLKSVSPFDVDTQKQIWNFNDSTFLVDSNYVYAHPVMRSAYTVSEGSLVLGTLKTDATKIGLMAVDVYGNKHVVGTATFSDSTYGTLLESAVLDFTAQSDGSVVMILENASTLNGETLWYEMLVCYNFSTNTLVWSLTFQQLYASYMARAIGTDAFYIDFYSETTNTLCRMKDNMIAVVGAADTGEAMYPFFTVIDATPYLSAESEHFTVHNYLATAAQATGGAQSYFTAVYYDGADFYVSGFANCDFTYEDMTYTGTIYQFSGDLATAQKLYEKERYLFLCIDGVGKNWYACGEYCDTGTILKGCYISSDMVSANTAPSLHVSKNSYCWFDQLCCYNGKIILYGTTSADKAGEDSPLPFVASYTATGSLLWENTSYTKYTQAYSLIPNAIGTYVLQLSGSARSSLHYVSADLLGNE